MFNIKRRECIELMGFGTMNKIFLGFEKLFWNTGTSIIQLFTHLTTFEKVRRLDVVVDKLTTYVFLSL